MNIKQLRTFGGKGRLIEFRSFTNELADEAALIAAAEAALEHKGELPWVNAQNGDVVLQGCSTYTEGNEFVPPRWHSPSTEEIVVRNGSVIGKDSGPAAYKTAWEGAQPGIIFAAQEFK